MNIPIIEKNVTEICKDCNSFNKIIKILEPLTDVLLINCKNSNNGDFNNCKACTGSLDYIHDKYGSQITLLLTDTFSKRVIIK